MNAPFSTPAAGTLSPFEQLRYGREILSQASHALATIAQQLDEHFCRAVELITACRGGVVVTRKFK